MRIGYRKRIRLAPGLNLNLGRRGVGLSGGPRGAKVSVGRSGRRASFSLFGLFARKRF